jgi:galactokinase
MPQAHPLIKKDDMELFMPGRICLFGEHSDWAGGYRRVNPQIEKGDTLICGTDQGLYARVEPHPDALVLTTTLPEGGAGRPYRIPMEPDALLNEARLGGFWRYIAGVAYQVQERYPVGGLVIDNHFTDLPVRKGLSSSAAACVLTARAFNQLYGLGLTVRDEMEVAYQGEITTSSRCGRMDQGCAFGNRPVRMIFDGDRLTVEPLDVANRIHIVVVDLGVEKNTVKILADLNRCYPTAQDEIALGVRILLGPINRRIVRQAVEALRAGDAARLGALMVTAQVNFDRYATPACPDELEAPLLHDILSHPALAPHIWGGKGVGSQGDGAAQFVARSAKDQRATAEIVREKLGMDALTLTINPRSR